MNDEKTEGFSFEKLKVSLTDLYFTDKRNDECYVISIKQENGQSVRIKSVNGILTIEIPFPSGDYSQVEIDHKHEIVNIL